MEPKTFLIGATTPDIAGIRAYLEETEQDDFGQSFDDAIEGGVPPSMALISFYAKLCYRSLVAGKNSNVTRLRDLEDNLKGCFASGHGSVFEHASLNFVTTNCSRVFTHELVRHRVGTAFSQTSGRYCTVEDAELVLPPELEDLSADASCSGPDGQTVTIADVMRGMLSEQKRAVALCRKALGLDNEPDFNRKKRLTSALRRIMPNGATNEIGWSVNIRSLRHLIEMRTSRHAEWEIRKVFHDVASIVFARWPLMLHGGERSVVDGLDEWTKLRV